MARMLQPGRERVNVAAAGQGAGTTLLGGSSDAGQT